MTNGRLLPAFLTAAALAACSTTQSPKAQSPATGDAWSGRVFLRQADLQGKDVRALDNLLGEPALKRAEGKGEFRRYAFEACALIVILYPDEAGAPRVQRLDAAAKISGSPKPDLDQCLARGPAPATTG